jgi:hypothetical protein
MTSAPWFPGFSGESTPEEIVAALRATDPVGLAERLGDQAFLLQRLASDPAALFETAGRRREEFSGLLGAVQASRGALDSLEARAVTALQETTRRERWEHARDRAAHEGAATPSQTRVEREADGMTVEDVSLLTRRSPHLAGRTLASARRLVESLPRTMSALASGQIAGDEAYAVADAVAVLEPDLAREVDRVLGEHLPEFDGAGTRRWKDAVATIAGELDPEGGTLRHRRARKDRHVTMTPGQNGMATLTARLEALDAQQIHRLLTREAERRRAAGDRGGHGAAMADALVDALLRPGDGTPPVTLEVGVVITDRALFRPDAGDVAHLEGYGAVPAEAVREQLRAALTPPAPGESDPYGPDGDAVRVMLRRLYTHPTQDELIAMDSTARAFPPEMRRFLSWRDTSCRGPFCNASVRQSDHIVPSSRGGPTSIDNGQGLCAHCNKKERTTASVERVQDPEGSGDRVLRRGARDAPHEADLPSACERGGGRRPRGEPGAGSCIDPDNFPDLDYFPDLGPDSRTRSRTGRRARSVIRASTGSCTAIRGRTYRDAGERSAADAAHSTPSATRRWAAVAAPSNAPASCTQRASSHRRVRRRSRPARSAIRSAKAEGATVRRS